MYFLPQFVDDRHNEEDWGHHDGSSTTSDVDAVLIPSWYWLLLCRLLGFGARFLRLGFLAALLLGSRFLGSRFLRFRFLRSRFLRFGARFLRFLGGFWFTFLLYVFCLAPATEITVTSVSIAAAVASSSINVRLIALANKFIDQAIACSLDSTGPCGGHDAKNIDDRGLAGIKFLPTLY